VVVLSVLVIFIVQNARAVRLSFLGAHLQLSLAVALLLAAIAGAAILLQAYHLLTSHTNTSRSRRPGWMHRRTVQPRSAAWLDDPWPRRPASPERKNRGKPGSARARTRWFS
jgi:hypothetical protein